MRVLSLRISHNRFCLPVSPVDSLLPDREKYRPRTDV
jgi:hypothetical protein